MPAQRSVSTYQLNHAELLPGSILTRQVVPLCLKDWACFSAQRRYHSLK